MHLVPRRRPFLVAVAVLFLGTITFTHFIISVTFSGDTITDEFLSFAPTINQEIAIQDEPLEGVNALLSKSVRILCLCVTSSKYHSRRAAYVKATWAKRCSHTVFVSDKDDERLGAFAFSNLSDWSQLWAKTRSAFKWAHRFHLNDFDWFVKADDDTYLIVENLRRFLVNYSPDQAYYMGRHFLSGDDPASLPEKPQHYASGGSAYVLSRKALSKLVDEAYRTPLYCSAGSKVQTSLIMEDIEMGRCLESAGVKIADTRDNKGRQRFNPFAPERHLLPGATAGDDWIRVHDAYPYLEGFGCCSDTAISFHYVPGGKMLELDYFLYRLRPLATSNNQAELDKVYTQLTDNNYSMPSIEISLASS